MHYIFLVLAVVAEVVGTSALKATEEFSRLVPSIVTVVSFLVSFVLMALSLKTIPIGVAYAMWSGLGIVLIAAVGWFLHRESLDTPAVIGMALIMAGCLTINLFSSAEAA